MNRQTHGVEYIQSNVEVYDTLKGSWGMMLLITANGVLMLFEVVQAVIEVALK